jgi:hypothetical protein
MTPVQTITFGLLLITLSILGMACFIAWADHISNDE